MATIRAAHEKQPRTVLVWTLRCPHTLPTEVQEAADYMLTPNEACQEYLVQTTFQDGDVQMAHIGQHTLTNLIKAYINATREQAKMSEEEVSHEDAEVMEAIVRGLAPSGASLRELLSTDMLISHCSSERGSFGMEQLIKLAQRRYELVSTPQDKSVLLATLASKREG